MPSYELCLNQPYKLGGNVMMKVQQNMNYQNIQNCIIKNPVIIILFSLSLIIIYRGGGG